MLHPSVKRIVLMAALIACALGTLAQAPQIALRSVDGRTFDLAKCRGKIVVLSFGATWLPMTDKELPAFQKLADRYAGRGVDFYWVSINSAKKGEKTAVTDAELQAFVGELGLRLSVLRDPERKAFSAFGLDALPAIVIIDQEGLVCLKVLGFNQEEAENYDPARIELYTTRVYSAVIRCLNQLLK